jgi:nicotinamidase-related amidase
VRGFIERDDECGYFLRIIGVIRKKMNNTAIITIDMQRDTLPGRPLEIPGTDKILPNATSILEHSRRCHIPIFHIVRIYLEDGSNAEPIRRSIIIDGKKILAPNSEGTEIFSELFPNQDVHLDYSLLLDGKLQKVSTSEFILYKSRWGAFYNTVLESELRRLSIQNIVFIGVNFPNCPRTSIYEASERDFNVIAISDGISGIYDTGIKELMGIGVNVIKTEEFLNNFK